MESAASVTLRTARRGTNAIKELAARKNFSSVRSLAASGAPPARRDATQLSISGPGLAGVERLRRLARGRVARAVERRRPELALGCRPTYARAGAGRPEKPLAGDGRAAGDAANAGPLATPLDGGRGARPRQLGAAAVAACAKAGVRWRAGDGEAVAGGDAAAAAGGRGAEAGRERRAGAAARAHRRLRASAAAAGRREGSHRRRRARVNKHTRSTVRNLPGDPLLGSHRRRQARAAGALDLQRPVLRPADRVAAAARDRLVPRRLPGAGGDHTRAALEPAALVVAARGVPRLDGDGVLRPVAGGDGALPGGGRVVARAGADPG